MERPTPEEIKAARTAAGLTQEAAAELVGLGGERNTLRSMWSAWENGRVPIPAHRWELFLLKTKV